MENAVAITKWYYIVDKGFGYYRLNNNSQLVVAMSKDEADIFSYDEARRRIKNGKKDQFYFLVPTEEKQELPVVTEDIKPELVVMEGTSYQQVNNSANAINHNTYDLSKLDWKEYLTQFAYIASCAKRYHDELNEQLSQVDLKICDVMHYVELYDLSEEESLYVVQQLKTYREQRRDIKDKMLIAETFSRLVGTSNNIAKCKETLRAIEGLEHRKYLPRQLTELFEGRELHVPKKITNFPVRSHEEQQSAEKEEERMEEKLEAVWRETVFDSKQTDWKQYAKQQMEFFEQAKQYICNLQIELDVIDGRIQDILREVEDANYNAVQGYNVFKQLKELRNVRKAKLKNLECVETLTGCFNCESMYEAYGYSLEVIEEIMGEP